MSISSFFVSLEDAAAKLVAFAVKQIVAAEHLLGAKTGNAKLNLVVTAVEGALSVMGIDVTKVNTELQAVVTALVGLFNKAGMLPPSAPPAPKS